MIPAIAAKVTVVTALGLIAAWLARGKRAAVRHALLAVVFGVILLLPIASIVVPPVQLKVPVMAANGAAELPPGDAGVIPPLTRSDVGDGAISIIPQSPGLSFSDLLFAGWLAGTAIFLLPVVIGLWQTRSVRRSGLHRGGVGSRSSKLSRPIPPFTGASKCCCTKRCPDQ